MAADSALHSLLELARNLLIECSALAGGDWDSERASRSQQDLERLADYAANLGQVGIHEAALDLYAYLGVFAEGTLQPKPQQREELDRLSESLRAALAALEPAHATGHPAVVLGLLPDRDIPKELTAMLGSDGLQLLLVDDGDRLAEALGGSGVQALLVSAEMVGAVAELLDGLADRRPELARIPLLAHGFGDAGALRLRALIEGADLWIDDLRDAAWLPQLRALLAEQDSDPYRVLVIDDDRQMTQYCRRVLSRAGMQVSTLDSAEGVAASVSGFRPDLILMDLYLPGKDGMRLTAELRQHSDSVVLPIVFLSGEHNEEARFQAIQAGGDDFLTKPIRPRHLVSAVRGRIKRVRALARRVGSSEAFSSGLLRKGQFLAALQAAQDARDHTLLALAVDQAEALDQRLGLAARYELEQALAQRLLRELGPADRICLWREFGFGVLLAGTEPGSVRARAESLRAAVASQPFKLQNQDTRLSLSLGMALPPREEGDRDAWIGVAFAALGAAQRLGGNRAEGVLGEEDSDLPPERLIWIREVVGRAARGSGVVVEFQPLLPLRGRPSGSYLLQLSLRDLRQPLGGVPRREFLRVARELGALVQLDRMALFRALEALDDQRSRNRAAEVVVPLDLACFGREQVAWLMRERERRDFHGQHLTVEFDAELLQARPALIGVAKHLRQAGVRVWLGDRSGRLGHLETLLEAPLDGLRLPVSAIQSVDTSLLASLIEPWHRAGRSLIVEGIDEVGPLAQLWNLGIDYLQGDAVAPAGPRLDFDFGEESGEW